MEIMPKVHLIPGIIANPYLIVNPDGLTLIDTGLPGSHKKILHYLSERGYGERDLIRIILTHSDLDHVGGAAALKRASGARVFASEVEAEAIRKGIPSRQIRSAKLGRRLLRGILQLLIRTKPVDVDEFIAEGSSFPVLGGLLVLDTPGHTPGHVSLFSPTEGILFCGDSIVSRDGNLVGSIPMNTWDEVKAQASVRKQAALHPRIVCSGHGPIVQDASDKMPVA
jgi:glyoxylase-like metal-dependent hydrolase (beta-lactamase superfamily II)